MVILSKIRITTLSNHSSYDFKKKTPRFCFLPLIPILPKIEKDIYPLFNSHAKNMRIERIRMCVISSSYLLPILKWRR
jgi:hypothetical protein